MTRTPLSTPHPFMSITSSQHSRIDSSRVPRLGMDGRRERLRRLLVRVTKRLRCVEYEGEAGSGDFDLTVGVAVDGLDGFGALDTTIRCKVPTESLLEHQRSAISENGHKTLNTHLTRPSDVTAFRANARCL